MIVVFIFIALSVVFELMLISAWSVPYFHFGIPLFSKRFYLSKDAELSTLIPILEKRLSQFKGISLTKLSFKEINPNEVAFRHKQLSNRQFTNVHGVLSYDAYDHVVSVRAYPIWYPYLIPLWPLVIGIVAEPVFLILTIPFIFFIVVVQVVMPKTHFTRITESLDDIFLEQMIITSSNALP